MLLKIQKEKSFLDTKGCTFHPGKGVDNTLQRKQGGYIPPKKQEELQK